MLGFIMENGSKLMVRPSGTEPKIKFYLLARGASWDEANARLSAMKAFVRSVTD